MASVAPLPIMNNSNLDIGRPGQQLLPGYVVKLLKTLKIPFGTDRTMNGVDVDPTIAVISHVIDCLGALRDINKPMGVSSFITKDIPLSVQSQLPTVQEIESELTALIHDEENKPNE